MTRLFYISLLLCWPACTALFAQTDTSHAATREEVTDVKESVEGLEETVSALKTTLDALKKIKLSGYIQFQYQLAESSSVPSFSGGNFTDNVRSRFQVRRGRLKVVYDNDLSQYVLEIDASQSGVTLRDAFVWVKDPWTRSFAFSGGQFYRPFGYENLHSSSVHETPEFARVIQTLFPSERDLGAQLEISPETGSMSDFNLKAGVFNGSGINAAENDRNKDFIGRAGYSLPFEEANLSIDGGVSVYSGKVTSNSRFIYGFDNSSATKRYRIDSAASNVGGSFGRGYVGGDLQLYYDIPGLGGMSLKGEYIAGQQPGTAASSVFYSPGALGTNLYMRNFNGWYLLFLQNVGVKTQFMVKYDVYDPNTDVEGNDIGAAGSNLTIADMKFSTLGFGMTYWLDTYLKATVYYDLVTNESLNPSASGAIAPYREDIKDNVLTARLQYKF